MTRILAIIGSYRDDGITDQAVDLMSQVLIEEGAEVEVILLRDYPIEFCLNCRACTQEPGEAPGECVHQDGMKALVNKIENADAYILASPTNFGSVTAIYKRFMERLVVYAYWPWGAKYPKFRKAKTPKKKAVLVSSSAAPSLFGRWMFNSRSQLKMTAGTIGAKTVGTLFTGKVAKETHATLNQKTQKQAKVLAGRLI